MRNVQWPASQLRPVEVLDCKLCRNGLLVLYVSVAGRDTKLISVNSVVFNVAELLKQLFKPVLGKVDFMQLPVVVRLRQYCCACSEQHNCLALALSQWM